MNDPNTQTAGVSDPSAIRGSVTATGQVKPKAANLRLESGALVATLDEGGEARIALDEMTLESGGFDGIFLFCRSASSGMTIASQDPRLVEALRGLGHPSLDGQLETVGKVRNKRRQGRMLGFGCFLLVVAACVGLFFYVPSLLGDAVDSLPISIDRQLGDTAFSQMEQPGPVIHEPVIDEFLQEVIRRLEPHARGAGTEDAHEFRVVVVDSDQVNAFALPGGHMVVLTGLLRAAESPDEVAGVMGHEMAHVTLRHGLRNIAHSAGTVLALQLVLGDAQGWVALAGELALVANQNDYSRTQEAAADREGVRMLAAAGLPPEGLTGFFELLKQESGSELDGAMNWLSTHPAHQDRIDAIEAQLDEMETRPALRPIDVDWAAVQAALP